MRLTAKELLVLGVCIGTVDFHLLYPKNQREHRPNAPKDRYMRTYYPGVDRAKDNLERKGLIEKKPNNTFLTSTELGLSEYEKHAK